MKSVPSLVSLLKLESAQPAQGLRVDLFVQLFRLGLVLAALNHLLH